MSKMLMRRALTSGSMQHNKSRQNWPCADDDPNRSLPALDPKSTSLEGKLRNEPAIKALGQDAMGCMPCLFKDLIGGYWGDILINEETGEPDPLPIDHESWHRLHQLAKRWYYRDAPEMKKKVQERENTLAKQLEEVWTDMSAESKEELRESIRQGIRKDQMDSQQDSEEFAMRILDGIANTFQ
jgi:hypothetical protein